MKKLLVLLVLIIVVGNSLKAQILTASELITQIGCSTFENYNNFITQKGFSYLSSSKNEDGNTYIFMADSFSKDNNPNMRNKNTSLFILADKGGVCVGFGTSDKTCYLKLLSAFTVKGFKSVNTTQITDGVTVNYKSGNYPRLYLGVTATKLTKGDRSWTAYQFAISKV